MRMRFDEELRELSEQLKTMGAMCENAIELAVNAYLEGNAEFAQRACEIERGIDNKEKDIEDRCLRLLLQQHPVARDLRLISSALKMITDLERIGDQAADIADLSSHTTVKDNPNDKHIIRMTSESVKMVRDAIDSYVKQDLELARSVMEYDDIVDKLFYKAKSDIIEGIRDGSFEGEVAVDTVMIAKYLERISDHATNIAEWVEYSITGLHNSGEMN